uniref:Uncharacterized protein n=1 Tax=Glossina morsitans morsitans TaxID=37546 RepID=A0A1B0FI88_GLOMM
HYSASCLTSCQQMQVYNLERIFNGAKVGATSISWRSRLSILFMNEMFGLVVLRLLLLVNSMQQYGKYDGDHWLCKKK